MIRYIHGFLLYTLEIIQDEKLITVLKTNFQPLFWRRLKNVMKQNKQGCLVNFLFESSNSNNLPSDQEVLATLKEMTSKNSSLEEQQVEFKKIMEQQICMN